MEPLVNAAWAVIVLVHAVPAAALFAPGTLRRLYGIDPRGDLGVLMTHRASLFLALVALSLFALFDPSVRRAAGVAVAISVVAFLALYARAGAPAGALRTIALVDAGALLAVVIVLVAAWRGPDA